MVFPGLQPVAPFIVSGYLASNPVGYTVRVTVPRTGDWEETITNSNGEYLIDISNFPAALIDGDELVVTANIYRSVSSTYDEYGFGRDINLFKTGYFIKTTGSDDNNGLTWETAWATINKAATTLIDGEEIHILGGIYNNEPPNNNIAPINVGPIGINYYVWGVIGTGINPGTGVGSVSVYCTLGDPIVFGSYTEFSTGTTYNLSSGTLTSTTMVVLYQDQSGGYMYKVRVGTVNNNEVSYGPITNVNTGYGMDMSILDSTHFVITYYQQGSPQIVYARIGTVSGNSISMGSVQLVKTNGLKPKIITLDSTHILIAYATVSTAISFIVGIISGGTITFGTPVIADDYAPYISLKTIDSTHFACGYMSNNTYHNMLICGSVSGDIITLGAISSFGTMETWDISIAVLDATYIAVIIDDGDVGGQGKCKIATRSGNDISAWGNEFIIDDGFESWDFKTATIDSTHFVLMYDLYDGSTISYITTITTSGDSIVLVRSKVPLRVGGATVRNHVFTLLSDTIGVASVVYGAPYHGNGAVFTIN